MPLIDKNITEHLLQELSPGSLEEKALKAVHSAVGSESVLPEDLEKQRQGQELFGALAAPAIGVITEKLTITGTDIASGMKPFSTPESTERAHTPTDSIRIPGEMHRLFRKYAPAEGFVILYCHGGGYTCGGLDYARVLAARLCLYTGADVLSFAYRLAPENPWPAAVEDAETAWKHLTDQGYDAAHILLAGDSAGGNLALSLALRLKERNITPAAMVLMSPWTDMSMSGSSYRTCKDTDPMLTEGYVRAVRGAYLGLTGRSASEASGGTTESGEAGTDCSLNFRDPRWSPLFADLAGMPPTLIQVGNDEILRSDSTRLYAALRRQGCSAKLQIFRNSWHVFQQMPGLRTVRAMAAAGRFTDQIMKNAADLQKE